MICSSSMIISILHIRRQAIVWNAAERLKYRHLYTIRRPKKDSRSEFPLGCSDVFSTPRCRNFLMYLTPMITASCYRSNLKIS